MASATPAGASRKPPGLAVRAAHPELEKALPAHMMDLAVLEHVAAVDALTVDQLHTAVRVIADLEALQLQGGHAVVREDRGLTLDQLLSDALRPELVAARSKELPS